MRSLPTSRVSSIPPIVFGDEVTDATDNEFHFSIWASAEVLAALEAVDLVVIFEEDTPIKLITQIRPSVLVKGGDYTRTQVVGHEIVKAHGGEALLIDILPGFSTTSLVKRAREGQA